MQPVGMLMKHYKLSTICVSKSVVRKANEREGSVELQAHSRCNNNLGCEVLTAVKMQMLVFRVVTPCGLIGRRNILPPSSDIQAHRTSKHRR
jgi:hypothetical protein